MPELFEKAFNYNEAKMAKMMGYYPYYRPLTNAIGPVTEMEGKLRIMLGSNNYMGVTDHPKVRQAAKDAIDQYGTGNTGSRFLNGTLDLHLELEEKLAKFEDKGGCITFTTGFQVNLGVIQSITQKGDVIISDAFNHASIVDGCRLSKAEVRAYAHNNMEDLERILKEIPKDTGKLIISDGVFSMEGDLANVPEMVDLAEKYEARVMIDDAHGVGYMGPKGQSTPHHFGVQDKVDIISGTFSKSFGSVGGFAAAHEDVIDYMQHHARSLIFSASMAPSQTATVLAALEVIIDGDDMRRQLLRNAARLRDGLSGIGFNTGDSETPIVPVIIGDEMQTFALWKYLYEAGVYTNPVRAPAVPPGKELLRTSVMATHTDDHIDRAVGIFEAVGKQMDLI
ncbi:MAG: aminotransferase class I/II-fold pyridoxal phosphate-dependent enzyme [Candidatus Kariarchaeaceae archaeon]|jgi:8-amino-7-oxononanoate synthase